MLSPFTEFSFIKNFIQYPPLECLSQQDIKMITGKAYQIAARLYHKKARQKTLERLINRLNNFVMMRCSSVIFPHYLRSLFLHSNPKKIDFIYSLFLSVLYPTGN